LALLLASAISLYLFLPSLAEVFSAWDKLGEVHPAWLAVVLVCESLSFVSVWRLQLIVLRTHRWTPIALSQLVGNAFNRITPGGGATGTAFQVRMLTTAGIEPSVSGPALTAQSLLISAVIVVLLLVSVPALLLAGATVPSGITEAALLGLPVFVVLAALATALLVTERPLCWIGERIDRFRSRHGRVDGEPLGEKLVRERNLVRHVLGERWWDALGCAIARWAFEYFALVIVLHAISANPSPALVFLAFLAASVLSMIPITPGGIGFVEVGLTGALVAAGVGPERALLATLVFRLVSFWLPLPIGLGAWVFYRRRFPRT
jgi:putative heme transporter